MNDSVDDPEYSYCSDELQPEDSVMISDCLQLLDSSTFMNTINLSMNDSNFSFNTNDAQQKMSTNVVTRANDETYIGLPEQSRLVLKTSSKTKKRSRSPLPSVEDLGPRVTPSNGGFTGDGWYFWLL